LNARETVEEITDEASIVHLPQHGLRVDGCCAGPAEPDFTNVADSASGHDERKPESASGPDEYAVHPVQSDFEHPNWISSRQYRNLDALAADLCAAAALVVVELGYVDAEQQHGHTEQHVLAGARELVDDRDAGVDELDDVAPCGIWSLDAHFRGDGERSACCGLVRSQRFRVVPGRCDEPDIDDGSSGHHVDRRPAAVPAVIRSTL
jgi:hypothetical protein